MSAPRPVEPAAWRLRALRLVVGLAVVQLVAWPLPWVGAEQLVGSPFGEVDNHYWMYWVTAQRLAGAEGPLTNWPRGWEIPLMDPAQLPVVLALSVFGWARAWQGLALFDLALAALGGAVLGDELARAVAGAARGRPRSGGGDDAPGAAGRAPFGAGGAAAQAAAHHQTSAAGNAPDAAAHRQTRAADDAPDAAERPAAAPSRPPPDADHAGAVPAEPAADPRVATAAALVGTAALAGAPVLAGLVDFGISESWPVGWLALHVAALSRWARTGGRGALAAAGLCFAAFLWTGWYADVFALAAGLVLGLGLLVTAGPRRALGWAGVAALAGATRLPALLAWQRDQHLWKARFTGLSHPGPLPDWRDAPAFGADLLSFLSPHPEVLPVSRTVYLGLATLLLAGVGLLAARRRPGVVLPQAGAAAVLLLLALGHWLRVGGGPALVQLPAGWLVEHVAALRGLSHWWRAAAPAAVFLAGLAALGAAELGRRAPRLAVPLGLLLAAGLLADGVYNAPTPWPRRTYALDPPPGYTRLAAAPGPLFELPVDDIGAPPPARSRRPFNQWQVAHGMPTSENYEGPDAVLKLGPWVGALNTLCGGRGPMGPPGAGGRGGPAALPEDLGPARADLREAGFRWLVVHRWLGGTPERCIGALTERWGPPDVAEGGVTAWRVDRAE